MIEDRLLELITRKLSGEASAEELEEIERIMAVDPAASSRFMLLQQYWEQRDNANQLFVEEAFHKISGRLDPAVIEMPVSGKRHNNKIFRVVAAATTIILIAGSFLFLKTGNKKDESSEKKTALIEKQNLKGVKSTLALSDGSKIWLNADSKIQYPRKFTGSTREVYLSGEAFFEVVKNPHKPFIIHLSNGTVRVLGTSFNIRAYDNEKIIETSVATGKVAFIPKYGQKGKRQDTVFLTADKKVRYLFTKEEAIVEPTVSKEDRAWIGGRLIFKGMSFEDIGVELERSFGKKVIFLSDSVRDFRMTGSFQNNSLEEIFFYLSRSTEFNYKITNDEVLISDGGTAIPD